MRVTHPAPKKKQQEKTYYKKKKAFICTSFANGKTHDFRRESVLVSKYELMLVIKKWSQSILTLRYQKKSKKNSVAQKEQKALK